jgi:hypothetical protein
MGLFSIVDLSLAEQQSDKLERFKAAPSVDVERDKLRRSLADVTKKRIAIARYVTVWV